MKTVIKLVETSVAYFVVEHEPGDNPEELFRKFYDNMRNDDWISDELEKGYQGRELEVSTDEINTEYIPVITREECEED